MENKLVLSIKPRNESVNADHSADYQFKLNDWELGRGVTKTTLEMDANSKPKLIIECHPDVVEIDGLKVEALLNDVRNDDLIGEIKPEVSI